MVDLTALAIKGWGRCFIPVTDPCGIPDVRACFCPVAQFENKKRRILTVIYMGGFAMKVRMGSILAGAAALAMTAAMPVQADEIADFYKGKQMTLVIGFSAGGMYGLNGRLMSQYIGKYIPGNPSVVVQHRTGAGGAKAANYIFNAAPKDGSVIAELSKDVAVAKVLQPKKLKYDPGKFNYLGRMNTYAATLMVWHGAGVKTVDDARKKEIIMANSGKASHSYIEAAVLSHYAGLKIKPVVGYRGAAGMFKAMESGEVHARIGAYVSLKANRPHWLEKNLVYNVIQTGLTKNSDLPNVPLMIDLMPNEESRKMAEVLSLGGPVGWGLQTPPGVPQARVAAMRKAFDMMVKDPGFLADAKKRKAPVNPATGAEVEGFIKKTLAVDPKLIAKMQKIAGFKS